LSSSSAFRIGLAAFGLVNAVLYAGLLPLWEGFDEPFHYAYVQQISHRRTIPEPGRSVLSQEVQDSLALVPVAAGVKKNLGGGITFGEYFRLPPARRTELREQLEALDPRLGFQPSAAPNYEAQQAPLAYLLLSPFDALWSGVPLPRRILRLRLVCAIASVLLTLAGIFRLGGVLAMPPPFVSAAAFVVLCSQMFYATTSHVSNDWLAVPLFCLLLAEAIARRPVRFALLLAAAVLVKAYFLALAPLGIFCFRREKLRAAAAALIFLCLAGPWYARNLVLRGNFSGMQETAAGAPPRDLLRAALHLPWLRTLWSTAHSALFTGNNSYIAFSALTLSLMLALLAVAVAVYLRHGARKGLPAAERILIAGLLLHTLAVAYSTVVAYWSSHGVAWTPSPWFWQPIWPAAMLLAMLGLSRGGRLVHYVAISIVWLWTYAIAATWLAKFIPFYAGLSDGRTHLADLPHWYSQLIAGSAGALDTVSLLPSRALLLLAAVAVTSAVVLAARTTIAVRRDG
jgi:hypothetical protein